MVLVCCCVSSVCSSNRTERLSIVILGSAQRLCRSQGLRSTAGSSSVVWQTSHRRHGHVSANDTLDNSDVVRLLGTVSVVLLDRRLCEHVYSPIMVDKRERKKNYVQQMLTVKKYAHVHQIRSIYAIKSNTNHQTMDTVQSYILDRQSR